MVNDLFFSGMVEYMIAAKSIKTLKLHYNMIQCFVVFFFKQGFLLTQVT